jgi:HlyD family secretion protein
MKMKFVTINLLCLGALTISCNTNKSVGDASGIFEATETIISAETNGKILSFTIEEGDVLRQDQQVGFIDSLQLHLSRMQLMQNQKAVLSGRPDSKTQLESLHKELENAISDRNRIEILVKGGVASQKQLDDADSRVAVIQSRIDAQSNTLSTTTTTLNKQGGTIAVQLAQVEDQLRKCNIINPINGTVLTKYAEANEMAVTGKPLYKIADLSTLILRAYVTGEQLPQLKVGQNLTVLADSSDAYRNLTGKISWISDKAEFTPKTIQTKEERANLVYAVKILVKNDGRLKPGMFAEVKF